MRSALNLKMKQKSGNASTKMMPQIYDALSEKTDFLNISLQSAGIYPVGFAVIFL